MAFFSTRPRHHFSVRLHSQQPIRQVAQVAQARETNRAGDSMLEMTSFLSTFD